MKISDFKREREDGLVCLSATFEWEDNDRLPQSVSFRYGSDESYFNDSAIAHPFLLAGIVPALRRGEKRIALDGAGACPWLVDNLKTFMGYLVNW